MPASRAGSGHEAAGFFRCCQCYGGVAVCGTRAAARQTADHRPDRRRHTFDHELASHGLCAAAARTRLGRGRYCAIEYGWAEGRTDRFAEIAAEFVQLKVDIILTTGSATQGGKAGNVGHADRLCAVRGPGGAGYVASLARPAATFPACRSSRLMSLVSGWNSYAKLSRPWQIASMVNADDPGAMLEMVEVQAPARKLGLEVTILETR